MSKDSKSVSRIQFQNNIYSYLIIMNTIRLTPTNVSQYIGHEIIFKSRHNHLVKRIISVSNQGKTITIEHPDLKNNLQIVSRKVYVIL